VTDFTKEELIDINVVLCVWIARYPGDKGSEALQLKVQSMLDNHKIQESCDHDWEFEFNDHHCLKCELRK